MLDFYSQFITPGDLCFDVGANIGIRSKVFLKLKANLIAIEPQKYCIDILHKNFSRNHRFRLVQKALGSSEGFANMRISNHHTISTLSDEWISSSEKTGRFSGSSWNETQLVEVTTLDYLIRKYGIPIFIKIDVEGYELEVVKGLSRPVSIISLEFVPEMIDKTFLCLNHLQSLGNIETNYSLGDSMDFVLNEWKSPDEVRECLKEIDVDSNVFGDLYIHFLP